MWGKEFPIYEDITRLNFSTLSTLPLSLSFSLSFLCPSRFLQLDLLLFLYNVAHILIRAMCLGAFDLIICGGTIVQIEPLV